MDALFGEMDCLQAVETTVLISVGRKESSKEALTAKYGKDMVAKAYRA